MSSLALYAPGAAALACDAPAPRWNPEHSWPAACETDVAVDGFVLLEGDPLPEQPPSGEGELQVMIQRVQDGVPLETFPGTLTHPDETSALFRSDRPLVPNADYLITAERRGPDGQLTGTRFTSAFTTGTRSLAPLAFSAAPTIELESGERPMHECVTDACGEQHCKPTKEMKSGHLVRIAVPALSGGIALKDYAVDAQLTVSTPSGQAPAVASADTVAMQAGRRSFLVIDVPTLTEGGEGCVTVTATDAAGHAVSAEPVCVTIPASSSTEAASRGETKAHASDDGEPLEELEYTADPSTATDEQGNAIADSAGGCSVAGASAGGNANAWSFAAIALALTLARMRSRKRAR